MEKRKVYIGTHVNVEELKRQNPHVDWKTTDIVCDIENFGVVQVDGVRDDDFVMTDWHTIPNDGSVTASGTIGVMNVKTTIQE